MPPLNLAVVVRSFGRYCSPTGDLKTASRLNCMHHLYPHDHTKSPTYPCPSLGAAGIYRVSSFLGLECWAPGAGAVIGPFTI